MKSKLNKIIILIVFLGVFNLSAVQEQKIKSKKTHEVVFVELGSVKCIPCKKMQPVMDFIKKEYMGKVKVVFHDVWTKKGKPFAKKFKIRLIPTQVFLDKNGKEFFRHEGFFPKDEIIKVLEKQGVHR